MSAVLFVTLHAVIAYTEKVFYMNLIYVLHKTRKIEFG